MDAGLERVGTESAAVLHELRSLIDGSGRYVRIAIELLASGETGAAVEALRVADDAMGSMSDLLSSRVLPVVEGTRSLGDAVVHAFRSGQPTHQAIAAAVELHSAGAASFGVRLGLRIEPTVLESGSLPVFPIVQNAVRNAVEAVSTQGGGRVEVDARIVPDPECAGGTCLSLMVVDDGPGIRLGGEDPFALGVSGGGGGSGIGLTISRDIAHSLGGRVSLGSVPVSRADLGWGTTCFVALLPVRVGAGDEMIGGSVDGSGGVV